MIMDWIKPSRFGKYIVLLFVAGLLSACATTKGTESDFDNANEIPERPGIVETLSGKKLEVGF